MPDAKDLDEVVIKEKISTALKRCRKSLKKSQNEVAASLGIMQQSYYKYEAGRSVPSAAIIFKLAEIYNVSADYLLGLIDAAPPANSAEAMPTEKVTGGTAPTTEKRLEDLEERLDRYDDWFKRKGIAL